MKTYRMTYRSIGIGFLVMTLIITAAGLVACRPAPRSDVLLIVRGPFVQSQRSDGAIIRWDTNIPCSDNEVEIEPDTSRTRVVKSSDDTTYHQVCIDGLEAGTTHAYRVRSGMARSEVRSLHTAPARALPFTFVAYGDSRTGHAVHSRLVDDYMNHNPAFIINAGDIVTDGRKPDEWPFFFRSIEPALVDSVYYVAIGNHEENSPLYFRFLALPGNERWYSFDYAGCHFICLDSNPWAQQNPESEQYAWLEDNLKANQDALLTFVAFHHPLYSTGNHGAHQQLREWWKPLFDRYGVDAVINGHDHDYEHSVVDGIHYIVTGGGGAPLHHVANRASETVAKLDIHHYCLVEVANQQALVRVIDMEGNECDSFVIRGK